MFSAYNVAQIGKEHGWLFKQLPWEDNIVTGVDVGWFGGVLILGTVITLGLWLLNKLFPQATISHPVKSPTHRTNVSGASETQQRRSQGQHR